MKPIGLLISWATPAASCPMEAIFSACMSLSCASESLAFSCIRSSLERSSSLTRSAVTSAIESCDDCWSKVPMLSDEAADLCVVNTKLMLFCNVHETVMFCPICNGLGIFLLIGADQNQAPNVMQQPQRKRGVFIQSGALRQGPAGKRRTDGMAPERIEIEALAARLGKPADKACGRCHAAQCAQPQDCRSLSDRSDLTRQPVEGRIRKSKGFRGNGLVVRYLYGQLLRRNIAVAKGLDQLQHDCWQGRQSVHAVQDCIRSELLHGLSSSRCLKIMCSKGLSCPARGAGLNKCSKRCSVSTRCSTGSTFPLRCASSSGAFTKIASIPRCCKLLRISRVTGVPSGNRSCAWASSTGCAKSSPSGTRSVVVARACMGAHRVQAALPGTKTSNRPRE